MNDIQLTVDGVLAEMNAGFIADESEYQSAGEFLVKLKQTEKIVTAHFEPERSRTHEAYKAVLSEIKFFTDKLSRAESATRRVMNDWRTEQERKRRAEEAERRRIAEEEERRRWQEEEERRLAEAIETGNEGVLDEPMPDVGVELPPILVEKEKPEVAGISYMTVWDFEIVDPARISMEFMVPDEQKIRKIVKALKDESSAMLGPGVRVFSKQVERVSTR